MLTALRFLLSLTLSVVAPGAVRAEPAAIEAQRIDYLIRSVEELRNAEFIRNGSSYDARAAADHLRLKLREAGTLVKTADDFIRLCASRSSVSGQPYQIRFPNGRLVESETFLRAKLKELEGLGR